jgi:hypothetical protein
MPPASAPAPVVWTIGATGELIVATSTPSGTGCAAAWPQLADGRATVLGEPAIKAAGGARATAARAP